MELVPQLGPQHFASWGQGWWGGQQLFPETPSLGSGEGVKWGEPLSQEEA